MFTRMVGIRHHVHHIMVNEICHHDFMLYYDTASYLFIIALFKVGVQT